MTSLMSRRNLLARAAAFGVAVALGGCDALFGKRWSFRYKLTLSLDTPDGVKTGSSVVQVTFYTQSFPEQGIFHSIQGESVYVDLGPGQRPLVTLLTGPLKPNPHWPGETGPDFGFMLTLFGINADWRNFEKALEAIARYRGSHLIEPDDLPGLVTFTDIADPKTVTQVDPDNLEDTLGRGVRWRSIELALTDEPVTNGIEAKLPWVGRICSYLDGESTHHTNRLSNGLSTDSFKDPLHC